MREASDRAQQPHPSITHDLANADRLAKLARWCFVVVAGVSALSLLGWLLGGHPSNQAWLMTKPTTALALVLISIALRLRLGAEPAPSTARRVSIVGCALGTEWLSLEALLGDPLELDARIARSLGASGHMTASAAFSLALLGVVTLLLGRRPRARDTYALVLTLVPLFFSLGALAGHGYGVHGAQALGLSPMVPLTALCVTTLCIGVFAARVPPDVASLIASAGPSSAAVRKLLLGVVSIPVCLGFVERFLFHQGVHETELGVAMLMVANMLLVFALTMRNMRALLAAQRERAKLERDLEQNREYAARYQAQLALQRSEEKYRALAIHAPVGIFEATLDGRCTFVNQRWTEITGYRQEEALGRGWDKAVHPDDFARLTKIWSQAIGKGQPFSLDFRYRTKNNQVAWVHGAAVPLAGDDGRVASLMGTVVDMTEQRRTLEALSKSEQNFRSLVERAPFGVLVTRQLEIVYANRAYLEIMGYDDLSEVTGKDFLSSLQPESRAVVQDRERARAAGEHTPPVTVRALRRDGSSISIEGDSAAMLFDGAKATVSVVRDVTERERSEQVRLLAEHTLRESLREKDALLKEIHHRVKNNLQVIVSLINLQASKLGDASTRAVFEETRSRVHAIALLHERLYGSKNIGRIDMRDYLDGLASDLSSSNVSAAPVELRVKADELYLEMDAAVPIGLIVNELVTNAYKHAFPGPIRRPGRIEITLERVGQELQIVVQDNGVGYPHALDPDTADSLGLLLISSLSRQLDGELRFEQRPDGARCVVRFPDREGEPQLRAQASRAIAS
ncbi:MAG TPA: PAS domain S-box protein [Polyangiales bacterium]